MVIDLELWPLPKNLKVVLRKTVRKQNTTTRAALGEKFVILDKLTTYATEQYLLAEKYTDAENEDSCAKSWKIYVDEAERYDKGLVES